MTDIPDWAERVLGYLVGAALASVLVLAISASLYFAVAVWQ